MEVGELSDTVFGQPGLEQPVPLFCTWSEHIDSTSIAYGGSSTAEYRVYI
jgi:hypothetical protein